MSRTTACLFALVLAPLAGAFAPSIAARTSRGNTALQMAVSAADVKKLRDATGAGMMDCKKALGENDGDQEASADWLRSKGLLKAAKNAGKAASEGLVEAYIHTGGRLGVIVEVNCQTDFVARSDDFKDLARTVAMQIAACPNVKFVKRDDVPADFVAKETAAEMMAEDLQSKPEAIREKIVTGRVDKQVKEMCLSDQAFIKDPKLTFDDYVKSYYTKLGENIQVTRFTRFNLGETADKVEEGDYADEVAKAAAAAAAMKL